MKKLASILIMVLLCVLLAIPAVAFNPTADMSDEQIAQRIEDDELARINERQAFQKDLAIARADYLEKLKANQVQPQILAETEGFADMSPRLPCSRCGGALKLYNTVYQGTVNCQSYPLSTGFKDKVYTYYYECAKCGNVESYEDTICTHSV